MANLDGDDLQTLGRSFTHFLSEQWPRERAIAWAKATGDQAFPIDLWTTASGLGWPALTVPEAHGGLDAGLAAAVSMHRAIGAAAAPLPMIGVTLACVVLARLGSDDRVASLLAGIAQGTMRPAFAAGAGAPLRARDGLISGKVADIVEAGSANVLFVRCRLEEQTGWGILPTDTSGLQLEIHPIADRTRTLGIASLREVSVDTAAFLPATPQGDAALARAAALAIAADALGGGEAILATAIEYMKVREQFGVLIGSFQALKHRVADHQAALVAAEALLEHAATMPADEDGALLFALAAKQHIAHNVAEIARDCIQLHGGVGFTAEFVPHVYLKRAKLNEALFGTRAELLDQVAGLLEAA